MKDIFKYINGKFVLQENISKKEKFERIRRPKKHQFEQTDDENTQGDTAPVANVGDPPPALETPPVAAPEPTGTAPEVAAPAAPAAPAAEKPSAPAAPAPKKTRPVSEFTSIYDIFFSVPSQDPIQKELPSMYKLISAWGKKNNIQFPDLEAKLLTYTDNEIEKRKDGPSIVDLQPQKRDDGRRPSGEIAPNPLNIQAAHRAIVDNPQTDQERRAGRPVVYGGGR